MGYGRNESETTLLKLETRNNISRNDGRDGYSMVNPFLQFLFLFLFIY